MLARQTDDICGRDIKNAVIDAAVRAALKQKSCIKLSDLLEAIDRIKAARVVVRAETSRPLMHQEREAIEKQVRQSLLKEQNTSEASQSLNGSVNA
jgi:ATP-dependent Zn protease